jgi:hypothetical protein
MVRLGAILRAKLAREGRTADGRPGPITGKPGAYMVRLGAVVGPELLLAKGPPRIQAWRLQLGFDCR